MDLDVIVKETFDSPHSHSHYRKVVGIDCYSLGNVAVYGSWRSGLSCWTHRPEFAGSNPALPTKFCRTIHVGMEKQSNRLDYLSSLVYGSR